MDNYFIPIALASKAEVDETNHELETTTLAQDDKAESHSEGLSIEPSVVAFQALNFLILVIILKKILYKPLLQLLQDREKRINDGLEKADRADEMMKESEITHQETIKAAKVESHQILESAKKSAEESKGKILEEAQKSAQEIIEHGKNMVDMERKKAGEELKQKTIDLVIQATEKILKEKVDADKDRKIIENSLSNYSL